MNSEQYQVLCSAPGRAGIIGNPTDMYGGAVLSCSVGLRARVAITQTARTETARAGPVPDLLLVAAGQECRIASRQDLHPRGDVFDLARAVLDYLRLPPLACRVQYDSEIPLKSGLAGSTALVV